MHHGLCAFWQSYECAIFSTRKLDFHIFITSKADALHEDAKAFEPGFIAVPDGSGNRTKPPRILSEGLDAKELHLRIDIIDFVLHGCSSQAPS